MALARGYAMACHQLPPVKVFFNHIHIIIGFLINVQVQGQHPYQ